LTVDCWRREQWTVNCQQWTRIYYSDANGFDISRVSETTNKAVDAVSHWAATAKETINQTTNSAVNTLNQTTSQAVESVNQATEKAKISLEDSIHKAGNMSEVASNAIKSAINGTVKDWIDSHPGVFR
jgi:glutamyl-tRNA reductase